MRSLRPLAATFALLAASAAAAETRYIDANGSTELTTIQAAIDASADGDTIVVRNGTYAGEGNRNIDFTGKRITVRSQDGFGGCVIDCEGAGRGFVFRGGERIETVLDGFTILNGFTDGDGGGILCDGSSPTIVGCLVSGCLAQRSGGGVALKAGDARLANLVLLANKADVSGGGLACAGGSPAVTNCTVAGNSAPAGGGVAASEANLALANTILWGNRGRQLAAGPRSSVTVTHCCVQDSQEGAAASPGTLLWSGDNIDADPRFALPGDCHLLLDSPCIDAGGEGLAALPSHDADRSARVIDGTGDGLARPDVGAFESNPREAAAAVSPAAITFVARENGPKPYGEALSIANCGGGTLNWVVMEECGWLQAIPSVGTCVDEVDKVAVKADPGGMARGCYAASLRVCDVNSGRTLRTVAAVLRIGGEIHVPADHPTLQDAIDAAAPGDVVIVADGRYRGERNRNIDFRGKAITVRSEKGPANCIVDCEGAGRGFIFRRGERHDSALVGITVTNGFTPATWPELAIGGGILCESTSPTITGNIIARNRGSGICCIGSASPDIRGNMIVENIADWGGCGIYCDAASAATIVNNTIAANPGGGVRAWGSACTVANCIIWGNGEDLCGPPATYSCVQDPTKGIGNIASYPHFVAPARGDYRLRSYSPCIDAGTAGPVTPDDRDIDGYPRNFRRGVDIGAHEKPDISPDTENGIGDGLPDDWENDYFGTLLMDRWDDPDADGLTNQVEYVAGLNPRLDQRAVCVSAANARDPLADGTRRHPFPTIRQGVDASTGRVLVAEGRYVEQITVDGKSLDIEGGYDSAFASRDPSWRKTVIDAAGLYRAVTFVGTKGGSISGFTITGGDAYHGGGICCAIAAPTIGDNVITRNRARCGGAIECGWLAAPVIRNNVIIANAADYHGGGIYGWGQSASIIANNTIVDNAAGGEGGAVCFSGASAAINGCILWANTSFISQIALQKGASLSVRYSDVADGVATAEPAGCTLTWAEGNIDADPLFADLASEDVHLKSEFGRWDANAGTWRTDGSTSPCIDAGDPRAECARELRPSLARVDMGAYGDTPEASLSGWNIAGDLNGDCLVSIVDLLPIVRRLRLGPAAPYDRSCDVNRDGRVDAFDIIAVRENLDAACPDGKAPPAPAKASK